MLELEPQSIELATDREPWDKQPGETSVEWQLFTAYRDLPPVKRTLVEAYRVAFGQSKSATAIYAICTPASKRCRWDERVELYDRYVDQEVRKQLLSQQVNTRLALAQLGMALREKAATALAALKITKEITLIDPDTGVKSSYPVSTLSPSAIVAFAKTGAALENDALGLSSGSSGGVQVNVGVGVGIVSGQAVNDDDILLKEAASVLRARKEQLKVVDSTADPA